MKKILLFILFSSQLAQAATLNVALNASPQHYNPALHSGILTTIIGCQLFAGLVRSSPDGKIHPYLATHWQVSADELTYTFYLDKKARFHDGTPVLAEDVIFSLETVRKYHPFFSMLEAIEKLEALDSHTVRIHLAHYHPALLLALTPALMPVLPKHIYGQADSVNRSANWYVTGSGPYQLVNRIPGKRIILKKFPSKRQSPDAIDQIIFTIHSGSNAIPLALETGEIQLSGFGLLDNMQSNEIAEKKGVRTVSCAESLGPMLWLAFNLERAPFSDLKVRKAFSLAVDRQFIAEKILGHGSATMDGPLIPSSPFYSPPEKIQETSGEERIAVANRLFDEAGFPRNNEGMRMVVRIAAPPDSPVLTEPLLRYLRSSLGRHFGIKLDILPPCSQAEWQSVIKEKIPDIVLDIVFSWHDPVIGIHRTYSSRNIRFDTPWTNTQGYRNPQVDALLEKAGRERNFEKRKEYYKTFQNIVRHDQPICWIATIPYMTFYSHHLHGLQTGSFWGILAPFDHFRLTAQ